MSNQIYERDGDDYEVPAPVSVISVDAEVVQSTGASTTKVMSQAAVTNKLSELSDSKVSLDKLSSDDFDVDAETGEISVIGGGGSGTSVVINPILSGDEETATSIKVGDEKYIFPNTNTYGFTPAQITMFEGILRAGTYSSDQSSAITAFIASLSEQPEPGEKTLSSISATKTKTSYEVDETFNTDDVVVTAHYSDSTTATVTTSATIGTVDTSTEGNKTLNISYTEDGVTKTTTITIVVGSGGGEVIYTQSELTCTATSDSQKFGSSHTPWVQGASYKYEFDYEVVANEGGITIDFRNVNGASASDKFDINSTVGSTGHIEHTMTSTSTRERQAFLAKNSGYTLKLTNITITKLS